MIAPESFHPQLVWVGFPFFLFVFEVFSPNPPIELPMAKNQYFTLLQVQEKETDAELPET